MTDTTAVTTETTTPATVPGALVVEQVPGGVSKVDEAAALAAAAAAEAAKNEKPKDEPKPDEDTVQAVEFEPTGDVGLDMALEFVGRLGLGTGDPAFDAAVNGDFSLLEAKLAGMGAKAAGYDKFLALAQKAYEGASKAEAEAQAIVAAAVHGEVGGEDNWNTIKAWASKEATPAEKEAINGMLTGGAVSARAAAKMLNDLYSKATGVTKLPGNPARAGASTGGAPTASRLTRREYVAEVDQLARRIGSHNLQGSPEYAALQARVGLR